MSATTEQRFDADKAFAYRALQDARAYNTDIDRTGYLAKNVYKRLERASRMMRPWSTDGTAAQVKKAIEYLGEISSILSHKIGPASRREFPEQGGAGAKKTSPAQLNAEISAALNEHDDFSLPAILVTDTKVATFPSGAVRKGMERLGFACTGYATNPKLRIELQGAPIFKGVNGPMWGGDRTPLRYEHNVRRLPDE